MGDSKLSRISFGLCGSVSSSDTEATASSSDREPIYMHLAFPTATSENDRSPMNKGPLVSSHYLPCSQQSHNRIRITSENNISDLDRNLSIPQQTGSNDSTEYETDSQISYTNDSSSVNELDSLDTSIEEKPINITRPSKLTKCWKSSGDVRRGSRSQEKPQFADPGVSDALLHLRVNKSHLNQKISKLKQSSSSKLTDTTLFNTLSKSSLQAQAASQSRKVFKSELFVNLSGQGNTFSRPESSISVETKSEFSSGKRKESKSTQKTVDNSSGVSMSTSSTSNPLLTKSSSLSVDQSIRSTECDRIIEASNGSNQRYMPMKFQLPAEMRRREFILSHMDSNRRGKILEEIRTQSNNIQPRQYIASTSSNNSMMEVQRNVEVLLPKSICSTHLIAKPDDDAFNSTKRDGSSQTCSIISLRSALADEINQLLPWKKYGVKKKIYKQMVTKSIDEEFNKPTCTCSKSHVKAKKKEILRTLSMIEFVKKQSMLYKSTNSLRQLPSKANMSKKCSYNLFSGREHNCPVTRTGSISRDLSESAVSKTESQEQSVPHWKFSTRITHRTPGSDTSVSVNDSCSLSTVSDLSSPAEDEVRV